MSKKEFSLKSLKSKIDQYITTDDIKSLAGLAIYLGVDTDNLRNIMSQNGAKAQLLRYALTCMEKDLVENGLRGKYNATMTSFLLKSLFNYHDRHDEKSDLNNDIKIELAQELKQYAE